MKESERDITNMSKLLAICALHSDDLFSLPDDLIHSVDNSIRMQREDSAFQLDNLLQVSSMLIVCGEKFGHRI